MTLRTPLLFLAIALATVGAAAACGAGNQSTHDGTTVTIEKPSDSSGAAPSSAPGSAPAPAATR
ncbi:MAG: hypothetical protein ACRELB_04560 [Polyangiaceae bacterium]